MRPRRRPLFPWTPSPRRRSRRSAGDEDGATAHAPSVAHGPASSSWAGRQGVIAMTDMSVLRENMVQHQIAARGVNDELILDAMREVPREAFMPDELGEVAYRDAPLPTTQGQTTLQPDAS